MTTEPSSKTSNRKATRAKQRQGQRQIKKIQAPRIEGSTLEGLERINLHAAGIDVGSTQNYVCVPAKSVKAGEPTVRAFGVFNADLDATVEWLKACGITTVAMEATGIYWMALNDKIETAGIDVVLVEP